MINSNSPHWPQLLPLARMQFAVTELSNLGDRGSGGSVCLFWIEDESLKDVGMEDIEVQEMLLYSMGLNFTRADCKNSAKDTHW